MKNPFGLFSVLCVFLCYLAGNTVAEASELGAWEKARQRLKREAIELFQVVLRDDKIKPEPCEFRAKWLEHPIPAQYFGSHLSAELVPASPPADPAEILDPSGTMREAFCDEANDNLRLSILVENLRRKELKDEKNPKVLLNSFRIDRREYTFPIFDKNYRHAVIVGSHLGRSWYWKPDGKFRGSIETAIGASVYKKRNGRWRFIKFDLFGAGHG